MISTKQHIHPTGYPKPTHLAVFVIYRVRMNRYAA